MNADGEWIITLIARQVKIEKYWVTSRMTSWLQTTLLDEKGTKQLIKWNQGGAWYGPRFEYLP